MKTKTIRTSVAKILFVFATVLIASTVFSSCSKNDDNPKLQQNEYPSLPDPKPQTVTINDAERPILAAFYEDKGNGKYRFNIYLSAERTEELILELIATRHITGKPIDLTTKEQRVAGSELYWKIEYFDKNSERIFGGCGNPDTSDTVFTTGLLILTETSKDHFNIVLKNARVTGKDGKEYTLTMQYSGYIRKL